MYKTSNLAAGIEFTIDMDSVLNALHNEEEKEK